MPEVLEAQKKHRGGEGGAVGRARRSGELRELLPQAPGRAQREGRRPPDSHPRQPCHQRPGVWRVGRLGLSARGWRRPAGI